MTLRAAYGVKLSGADAIDFRLAAAALVAGDNTAVPRAGIFGRPSTLVTGRTDMNVDVARFLAALSRGVGDGISLTANDGTTQVLIPAVPSANSRWDVVYARQRDSTATIGADPDNQRGFYVQAGIASATPALADTLAAVPVGGLPLASVLVPSTATNTNGMTINQIAPYTALRGSAIPFRTKAELDLWTTASPGQRASVATSNIHYEFSAAISPDPAGWWPVTQNALRGRATRAGTASIPSQTGRTAVTISAVDTAFSRGDVTWAISGGGLVCPVSGEWLVRARITWPNASGGTRLVGFQVNGTEPLGAAVDTRGASPDVSTYQTPFETLILNAGDIVQVSVAQTSGGALLLPNPAVDLTMWYMGRR